MILKNVYRHWIIAFELQWNESSDRFPWLSINFVTISLSLSLALLWFVSFIHWNSKPKHSIDISGFALSSCHCDLFAVTSSHTHRRALEVIGSSILFVDAFANWTHFSRFYAWLIVSIPSQYFNGDIFCTQPNNIQIHRQREHTASRRKKNPVLFWTTIAHIRFLYPQKYGMFCVINGYNGKSVICLK